MKRRFIHAGRALLSSTPVRPARTGTLLLAALGVLLAGGAAMAQSSAVDGRAWLRVENPDQEKSSVDLPYSEVSGYAGARGRDGHDLIIVIDISDSTTEHSGVDLDGDGEQGTTGAGFLDWLGRQPEARESLVRRLARSDFDDSVLMAELGAAYELVRRVDARLFRIGIVAFSGHAWLVAPLGSDREQLIDALEHLRWNFFYDLGGTDFVDALRVAAAAFDAPDGEWDEDESRSRSILFLSDGAPSASGAARWEAEDRVLAQAREAGDAGARVYAYALGPQAIQALDVYRGMAELTGGRFEKIERPGDAVARLRSIDLTDLAELRIQNLTTGEAARAVRTFPDGFFDGLVELRSGNNLIKFTAVAKSGSVDDVERIVRFDDPPNLTGEARAQRERELEELAEGLRERTVETEFLAEIARRRPPDPDDDTLRPPGQRRVIDLRAKPKPNHPPPD